jgi:PhnB protein
VVLVIDDFNYLTPSIMVVSVIGRRMSRQHIVESTGHELRVGNNITLNLEPDTREETEHLYDALSEGSTDCAPLADMFWGATWGTCLDRFGVRWMFNFASDVK